MVNPELVEYAKNQLKAGSSANYIRTVLIKQGWGERDVDEALGTAQGTGEMPDSAPVAGEIPGSAPHSEEAPSATPNEKMSAAGKSRFLALAGLLTGVFLIIYSVSVILTEIDALATSFNVLPWVTAIVGLIAGIFWVIECIKK